MNTAIALFLRSEFFRRVNIFDKVELIRKTRLYIANPATLDCYDVVSFESDLSGVKLCEEIFDITNNPMRNEERNEKFPNQRSLSVGDVVCLEDGFYLCLSVGWKKVFFK